MPPQQQSVLTSQGTSAAPAVPGPLLLSRTLNQTGANEATLPVLCASLLKNIKANEIQSASPSLFRYFPGSNTT